MSSSELRLEDFRIPLDEIKVATYNFSLSRVIGSGRFGKVYRGRLSERFKICKVAIKRFDRNGRAGKEEFLNKLKLMSRFQHENITPFIGYCDDDDEMITVTKYAINGSLDYQLQDHDRRRCITWAKRLKICIGVARGLQYLHSGLGKDIILIHRDINGSNIYLDENLEPQISDSELSVTVPKSQQKVSEPPAGTRFYLDPIYQESGILKAEADVYSFGVLLFEILTGLLAYDRRRIGDDEPQLMIKLVWRYYDVGLHKLIDPFIKDQIVRRSLLTFEEMAYKCISFNTKDRPTMDKIIKTLEDALDIQNQRDSSTFTIRSLQSKKEDFQIPLEEINNAKQKFGECIGSGGFGKVYKGKLSEHWNNRTVAIKCLNLKGQQGKPEFNNELKLISMFHHENIIAFIGYCDKGNDRILVFEYAANGSLERHLVKPDKHRPITWAERLKICIGAARGLKYLHLGGEDKNTVIHRDVKSGNILLDEKFVAKICDFGLSKSGPDDQPYSKLFTKAAGTPYYIDPSYQESGILRTESDVYSFGVVMFELLTGIPAWHKRSFGDGDPQLLINLVRRYYNQKPEEFLNRLKKNKIDKGLDKSADSHIKDIIDNKGLDKLVDPLIKDKIDIVSLHTFTDIAYKCIDLNLEKRPTMERIIDRIEDALELQETYLAKAAIK